MEDKAIAIIIGTKAEMIKTVPIMLELEEQGKDYWFIHTGQHPLGKACDEFGVKKPDFVLSTEPEISTKFWSKVNRNSLFWFIGMILKLKRLIKKIKPKYVLYHGDTMSTAAGAISTSQLLNLKKDWKNVHLEAGLRSGSLLEPFPEEISRRICDKFSDILFAVSDITKKNLEKYNKIVINTGNTILDSAAFAYKKADKRRVTNKEYALINIHRHENLNSRERLSRIVEIINHVGIESIWPLHDNTKLFLEKYRLMEKIKNNKKVKIVPLTDYFNFISMIANCKYLITDGGSIQEESLVFKKPCIILRERTERIEGMQTGINFLTKLDIKESLEKIKEIEENKIKRVYFKNPYGEEGVSKRIIEILK